MNGDTKLDIAVSGVEGYRVLTNSSTPGSFSFTAQAVETTSTPAAVALADVNGDGFPDLITADSGNDTVSIHLGRVGGGFAAGATTLFLPTGAGASSMVVTDLNGDQKPDIAVANLLTGNVTVFMNTATIPGTVSFSAGASFVAGNGPIGIVAADFNGDGHTDLAVADSAADLSGRFDVSLLVGDGTGNFAGPITLDSGFSKALTGLAQGDLSGDNLTDLAISSDGGLNVLLNNGALFVGASPRQLTSTATTSVAIGPIDTNATNDIAATTATGQLLVFQGDGQPSPSFAGPTTFSAGATAATGVTIKDLNADGLNDLLMVNNDTAGTVTVLKNTTVHATSGLDAVTFMSPVSYGVGDTPVGLAVADTNQDLPLDVVTANANSDDAWTLLGFPDGTFRTPTDQGHISQAFLDVVNRLPNATEMSNWVQSLGQMELFRLAGPRGSTVPLDIQAVDTDPRTELDNFSVYTLTFAPQVADGNYSLLLGATSLGNDVTDLFGNPMNQNGVAPNGEFPADRFNGPLAVNTSDNGRFVTGLFHDIIQRPADTPTFLSLLGPVDSARNGQLTPTALLFLNTTGDPRTAQYRNRLITSYFQSYLGAPPSTSDRDNWRTLFFEKAGKDERFQARLLADKNWADQSVAGSPYLTRALALNPTDPYGNTDPLARWLTQVFKDVLGRIPGKGEISGWVTKLNTGTSKEVAAFTFLNGGEYRNRLVTGYFKTFLGRTPMPGEITPWVAQFTTGARAEQIIAGLLGQPEYFQYKGNTNPSWLTSLYRNLLGRDPSTTELSNDVAKLLTNYVLPRQGAANSLLTGTEYRTNLITQDFQKYLGRDPSTDPLDPRGNEVAFWLGQLSQGVIDERVIAKLVSSDEYFFGSKGGGNSNQWVTAVYRDILGRNPTSSEVQAALQNDFSQRSVREQFAMSLLTGDEYRKNLITSGFNTYLGRNPTQPPTPNDELTFWLNRFKQGISDEGFIASLLATVEHYLRPHLFP